MRRLRSDGVTDSFAAILDDPAGCQVIARRLLPHVLRDKEQLSGIESRARDLVSVRHPSLVPVLDYVAVGEDRYVIEEWVDAVPIAALLQHLRESDATLPHNVFLNLATQICNGLEALHSRAGESTASENVLHTALSPSRVLVRQSGKVVIGGYGLIRSPTATPTRGVGDAVATRLEYLSPEQTHPGQQLTPASDIFSLGTVLYELLTNRPMFRAKSNLQTIHRVRRAEVTSHLLEVKELLPGLDRVLYRALSLNPRHRYQRAFVLREDLRGLMAGFSFANIEEETQAVLGPLFATRSADSIGEALPALPPELGETTASLLEPPEPDAAEPPPSPGTPEPAPSMPLPATGASVPAPEAFEGESVTEVNDPQQRTWPAPSLSLEVEELSTSDVAPDDDPGTAWFPRPRSTELGADAPPPDINPLDPEALAQPGHEPSSASGFEDEVNTEVKPTAKPAAANDNRGNEPSPSGEKQRQKKATTPEPLATEVAAPDDHAAGPPAAAADDDDDDLLDWKRSSGSNSGIWLLVAGAVAAASLLLCLGLGGTGALMGSSAPQEAELVAASSAEPPEGARQAAPVPASEPTPASEPVPAVEPEPEPEPEPERLPQPTTAPTPTPSHSVAAASTPARSTRSASAPPAASPRPAPSPPPAPLRTRPSAGFAAASRPTAPAAESAFPEDSVVEPLIATTPTTPEPPTSLEAYTEAAYAGRLSADERATLEAITPDDEDEFSRANTLLYEDAKARDSLESRAQYLAALFSLPANRYRPELIIEDAELSIRKKDWQRALELAGRADQYWARMPSELIFTRRALIHEIRAQAFLGQFYASGGDELGALEDAIRGWQRYREHVARRQRADLLSRADRQLSRLYDMQERLQ